MNYKIKNDFEYDISIVMAVYNRKELLLNTLCSFQNHSYGKNIQVILIDDASSEKLNINKNDYSFDVDLFHISSNDKKHINPCVPYNLGLMKATGRYIIIQNPECFHLDNICSDALNERLLPNTFRSYACYSLNISESCFDFIANDTKFLPIASPTDGESGWYNHPEHRPSGYHFCNLYHWETINKLEGFDLSFSDGRNFDDEEFLYRALNICDVQFVSNKVVLHQYHRSGPVASWRSYRVFLNYCMFKLHTKLKISVFFVRYFFVPLCFPFWIVSWIFKDTLKKLT